MTLGSVDASGIAITLTALGGAAEVIGVSTVIREISRDRDRARRMFSTQREYKPPERRYPQRLGRHSFGTGGFGGRGLVAASMRPSLDDQITDLAAEMGNAVIEVQRQVYADRDDLERCLLTEIDSGYNQVRSDLKEVLEGSASLRVFGVAALLLGVALTAAGSIVGNL